MNNKIKAATFFITLMLGSLSVYGESKKQFCEQRDDIHFVRKSLQRSANRLAFRNQGGLLNLGTCWWHDRFTRNAAYLAKFNPHAPRPRDQRQVFNLVMQLRLASGVVEIPGYENISEFSKDWEHIIQWHLNDWQIFSGFIAQSWIKALSGNTYVPARILKMKMDETYERVTQSGEVVFYRLQLPGIPAHSWLVTDIQKTNTGYRLRVIDSNRRHLLIYNYKDGDTSFSNGIYNEFVPYIAYTRDENRLRSAVESYCSN